VTGRPTYKTGAIYPSAVILYGIWQYGSILALFLLHWPHIAFYIQYKCMYTFLNLPLIGWQICVQKFPYAWSCPVQFSTAKYPNCFAHKPLPLRRYCNNSTPLWPSLNFINTCVSVRQLGPYWLSVPADLACYVSTHGWHKLLFYNCPFKKRTILYSFFRA
jgi:hypothetical protein